MAATAASVLNNTSAYGTRHSMSKKRGENVYRWGTGPSGDSTAIAARKTNVSIVARSFPRKSAGDNSKKIQSVHAVFIRIRL